MACAFPVRLLLFAPVLLVLLAPIAGSAEGELERARALEKARDWPGVAALLGERARRAELSPDEERLLGLALEQLGRLDEAAQRLDVAADGFARAGREPEQKATLVALRRVDPLSARREPFVRKVATTLLAATEELLASGDAERALALAERIPRIARGKEVKPAADLLARARASFEKVQLAQPAEGDGPAPKERPLVERESEHYRLSCHLEPDVVDRLGRLMDDVHAYYVQIYFDGDAKKARGAKATIVVAPSKEAMLKSWPGDGAPEGWWSAGTNEVHAYDTRSSTGKLDEMLETLFHEASHQFMTILAGGGWIPAWLNEGTASFFEGAVAMADGRVLWPRAALRRLESLRYQIAKQQAPRLRDVIEFEGAGSYPPEYYAWGWGLVYFLQEYEDPTTLDHPYRPLYAQYRSAVIRAGSGSFAEFEKTFLNEKAPRPHPDYASFAREWEAWMLEKVVLMHGRNAPSRAARLEHAERLIAAAAADAGAKGKRGDARSTDLLSRALVDFEWVRQHIDQDKPDGEVSLRQADVLERLSRASSAAERIEEALRLADEGRFALDAERKAELEKRLAKLDQKNAALRAARQRSGELTRTALTLVADYRASGLTLRAFTLAADLAAALGEPLAPLAAELRAEARAKGLLLGSIRAMAASNGAWVPLRTAPLDEFEAAAGSVVVEAGRGGALIDGSFAVTGDYEVRARLVPDGTRNVGWSAGFVVAGAPERACTIVGLDDRGMVGLWTQNAATRGSSTLSHRRTIAVSPPVAAGEAVELAVRVLQSGVLEIRVGERPPLEARLDSAPAGPRHAGVYAKNARVRFEDPLVELLP